MVHLTAGVHKIQASKFRTMAPNIYGPTVRNIFHVIFTATRILR